MTIRGGGAPSVSMAVKPLCRMDPPLRNFAADAQGCIMVPIRRDRPHTSLWRDEWRPWQVPLRSSCPELQLSGDGSRRIWHCRSGLDTKCPIQVYAGAIKLAVDEPAARVPFAFGTSLVSTGQHSLPTHSACFLDKCSKSPPYTLHHDLGTGRRNPRRSTRTNTANRVAS
jgi:hypothetical protein